MNEWIRRVFKNFARPDFPPRTTDKIREADETIAELYSRRDALEERRMRLLEMQSTPRGQLHGRS